MSGALRRADRWLLAEVPVARFAAIRILVVGYAVVFLAVRFGAFWSVAGTDASRFAPVGVLAAMGEPLAPGAARAVLVATVGVGVAALVGWRWRWTGPAFAVGFLVTATYRVSWGHVLHTDHLVALHLLALAAAPASWTWSLDARRAQRAGRSVPARASGWPLRVMTVTTLAVYVLAGLAKLRYTGLHWMGADQLRHHVAYDNLRKVLLGDLHSPLGGWLTRFGWLFPPAAVATVAVELGAVAALAGGRIRTAWVVAAWGFHVGIVAVMAISFPYELVGIAYAPMFAVEQLPSWWRGVLRRGGPVRASSASP